MDRFIEINAKCVHVTFYDLKWRNCLNQNHLFLYCFVNKKRIFNRMQAGIWIVNVCVYGTYTYVKTICD